MKQILILALLFASLGAWSQPKLSSKKDDPKLETIEIKGVYQMDTVAAKITIEAEEGYLKRIDGYVIVKSFIPVGGQPQPVDQKFYDAKGVLIKPELIDKFVPKQ